MTPDNLMAMMVEVTYTIIMLVCILVLPGMLVGLLVSIIQAVTQIQEQTLSFLPRFVVTMLVIIFAGQWMVKQMLELFNSINQYILSSMH
ncbi:FliQ family flagellar biosynthesis protein [Buttiauxella ferragutiae ATCC 51602]|jgi:flagellar biosynthetic protein FliQ|uniref:FliQ family flagellar biosynthesis protein n=1 Tax=Buttiauxella ferragutiae ATCC 51602 TaxID=1354252 RepID=A0ABX2W8T9_9ENTR|nr:MULTISPECIES: flagellar biosynthetic protein FliQ [Buttiauxella]OAT28089.1 FliQ family flagellar biosynthesis protein [Buttiauxella ferragutiae ATCC 51602]TDN49793.1 flagellar biosynthetic protein FliQ [Buttiauxella sp. JUb87]